MIVFQWVVIPLFSLLTLATLFAGFRRSMSWPASIFWSAIWLSVVLVLAFPSTTMVLARLAGIGRGADLLIYLVVLVMFGGFFAVYLRFRRVEQKLSRIVRQLAIQEAVLEQSQKADSSD